MRKKTISSLIFFLTFSLSLSLTIVSVFAEEIESKATVKVLHDSTLESERSKEMTNDLSKKKDEALQKKLDKKSRLPQTNEHINETISIIGVLVLVVGIVSIYRYNKRNGENKNEKD